MKNDFTNFQNEISNIENHPDLYYIAIRVVPLINNVRYDFKTKGAEITYTGLDGVKTGRYHVEIDKDFFGTITAYRYIIFLDDCIE